jgi:hypothetical protein
VTRSLPRLVLSMNVPCYAESLLGAAQAPIVAQPPPTTTTQAPLSRLADWPLAVTMDVVVRKRYTHNCKAYAQGGSGSTPE